MIRYFDPMVGGRAQFGGLCWKCEEIEKLRDRIAVLEHQVELMNAAAKTRRRLLGAVHEGSEEFSSNLCDE